MKIFAVIVTYNAMRREWIDRCLQSLQGSTVPITTVVIDNLSTDGTRKHVPAHYSDIVWLPQEKNLGFGQANNIGIRYALNHGADYVLLLNQDASLHSDALQLMLNEADGKRLVTPTHYNGKGDRLDYMFSCAIRKANEALTEDYIINNNIKPSYPAKEICAACWLMPVSLIQTIGGFNPLFFQYSEDNNYYQRMVYHGLSTTIYVPKAKMFHDRQTYGSENVFKQKKIRRELLLIATNINYSFLKCIAEWIRTLLRCYVYYLRRNQYTFGTFTKDSLWLIRNTSQIYESRKKEKGRGQIWL